MKKFILIFLLICISVVCFFIVKQHKIPTNKAYDIKFECPNDKSITWEKDDCFSLRQGFTRFYTEEMVKKYPEINNRDIWIGHNDPRIKARFEIIRNENGLQGVFDTKEEKFIIPQQYRNIEECESTYCMFFKAEDKKSVKLIDYKNNVIYETDSDYDDINCKWYGVEIKNNNKYGIVSYEGKEILKPEYDSIIPQEHFGESGGFYYIVQKDNQYGVFDVKGRNHIKMTDTKILPMTNGGGFHYFEFEKKGKRGVIDFKGNIILPPEYERIEFKRSEKDKNYFVACKNENDCETLNSDGEKGNIKVSLKNIGSDVIKLSDDYYIVGKQDRGMRIVHRNGTIKSEKYDSIKPFGKYFALIQTYKPDETLTGVIDFQGNILMKQMPNIEIEKIAKNGLIKIIKDGKFGVVYNNELIADTIYDNVFFYKGHVSLLYLKDDGEYYYNIASFEDFAQSKGKKYKTYNANQLEEKYTNECFRFIKDNGEADVYCKNGVPDK